MRGEITTDEHFSIEIVISRFDPRAETRETITRVLSHHRLFLSFSSLSLSLSFSLRRETPRDGRAIKASRRPNERTNERVAMDDVDRFCFLYRRQAPMSSFFHPTVATGRTAKALGFPFHGVGVRERERKRVLPLRVRSTVTPDKIRSTRPIRSVSMPLLSCHFSLFLSSSILLSHIRVIGRFGQARTAEL